MSGQVLISELSSCQISTALAHVCQSRSSDIFQEGTRGALRVFWSPIKLFLGPSYKVGFGNASPWRVALLPGEFLGVAVLNFRRHCLGGTCHIRNSSRVNNSL